MAPSLKLDVVLSGDEMVNVVESLLHAGMAAKSHELKQFERHYRWVSRPRVSVWWLVFTPNGSIHYPVTGYAN